MQATSAGIAVLDIEASGFGPASYPIEVGVVLPNGDSHCYLVRPHPTWSHWDESAEALHGISRQVLVERGRPVREVASILNLVLDRMVVYSDAWNYDNRWLSLLYYHAETPQTWHLAGLNSILSKPQMDAWTTIKAEVIAEMDVERHRASTDARVLQLTWQRIAGPGSPVPGNGPIWN